MLDRYNSILVAVDGSKQAEEAFERAVEIAKSRNAKLFLAHVVNSFVLGNYDYYSADLLDHSMKRGNALLDELEARAQAQGLDNIEKIVRQGNPKVVIATELVKDNEIDLLILGATGLNAFEKFMVGSTSEYVIRNAKCDVLIVR